MNNPLMFNDPIGEFWEAGIFLTILAYALPAAAIGVAISTGIYIIQSAINNNWTLGGFAKSILIGAVTGAVSAGIGQVFSTAGFWATAGVGALSGGATGGITALITGDNFLLQGVLKGAVIGGAVAGVSWAISRTVAYYRSKTPDAITSTELKDSGYDLSDQGENYYTTDQQVQNDFNRTTGDYQASVDNINTEYKVATNQNLPKGSTLSQPWKQIITNDPRDSGYVLGYTTNRNKNWWEFLTKGEKSTILIAPNLGLKSDVVKQAVFGH